MCFSQFYDCKFAIVGCFLKGVYVVTQRQILVAEAVHDVVELAESGCESGERRSLKEINDLKSGDVTTRLCSMCSFCDHPPRHDNSSRTELDHPRRRAFSAVTITRRVYTLARLVLRKLADTEANRPPRRQTARIQNISVCPLSAVPSVSAGLCTYRRTFMSKNQRRGPNTLLGGGHCPESWRAR